MIQLGSTTGIKCVSQLTTWAYCASDNYDTTGCCKARGEIIDFESSNVLGVGDRVETSSSLHVNSLY